MDNNTENKLYYDETGKAHKPKDLKRSEVKTTEYIWEYEDWGRPVKKTLFTKVGQDYTEPALYVGDEWTLLSIDDSEENVRKVYYESNYGWKDRVAKKIELGLKLKQEELEDLALKFKEVYRETGENGKRRRSIVSVLEIGKELYALEWEEGLTEGYEDYFDNQPYLVELEEEQVVITKKTIVKRGS